MAGSSRALLRLPLILAFATVLPIVAGIAGAILSLTFGRSPMPYVLFVAMSAYFAVVFMVMGVMGEQVRIISERTRNTPLVIERERINFSASEP